MATTSAGRPSGKLGGGRRRFLGASLGVLLAIVAAGAVASTDARQSSAATRVLFIGNSYTYVNNLPELIAKLAAARQQDVEAVMVAPGGWRLKDHWEKGEALAALRRGRWDYVVLQEQSTLGVTDIVDGEARVSSDEIFRPFAEKWAAEVHKAGATPVFYLTWARKARPQDQAVLDSAYGRAATAGHARLVPVGMAWSDIRRDHPEIGLFAADGSHPSPAGSYLAACTFYAAFFDRSPVGLPRTVTGMAIDLASGTPDRSKEAVLVDLPPDVALVLQTAAWKAWQNFKAPLEGDEVR